MQKSLYLRGKRIFAGCLALPIVLLCVIGLFQQSATAASASGYDISSYSTKISIAENNVYSVNEAISADFSEARHGIYRYVPYRQEMLWTENGGSNKVIYHTKVSAVSVLNDPFTTYNEDGNLVIRIGDADKTVTGNKTYNISYFHSLGDDKIKSEDFVYYNLIGADWDCTISNVSFEVTLPKAFDSMKIHFFSENYGSKAEAPVSYTMSGTTITGSLNGTLSPGQALTLQIDLPEGYFNIPAPFPWAIVIMLASGILSLLSLLLFLRFGRDPVMVKPVEFYPPDAITSAEAGYIIDSSVDDKDVVSLIIYWASKGYLAIDQTGRLKLIRQKDLPESSNKYEIFMFNKLFSGGGEVEIDDLKETFYTTIATTEGMIKDLYSAKDKRLYDPKSLALRKLTYFMSAALIFAALFYSINAEYYIGFFSLIVSFVGTAVIMAPFASIFKILEKWNGLKGISRTSGLVFSIIAGVVLLLIFVAYFLYMNLLLLGAVTAVAAAFINVISIFMRKRTAGGNDILGKLLGFKNFIEVAEKPRLEKLVEENPSYFYDVIPYAYVLGVSDKWAKKFEGIAMRPPEWYYGRQGDVFTPLIFQSALFHSMVLMNTSMVARPAPPPSSNSGFGGGGFGGGGFSGGGFGGGGGGSW
ncbi:MAG: hypothetical protein CVU91_05010 [Firmicutes bacterium HGW-Firmicutes-16]|nr:MAG: hypothetical protein CVU91_05010 [Firmicutes bacterium HGW-Firmicutes-16]